MTVLAAGHSDGQVVLYCVEDGKCLHRLDLVGRGAVTSMEWDEHISEEPVNSDNNQSEMYVHV